MGEKSESRFRWPSITLGEAADLVEAAAWVNYGNFGEALHECQQIAANEGVPDDVRAAGALIVEHIERHAARRMVHMRTGFGCDMPVESVLESIEASASARWSSTVFGPALAFTRADGSTFLIDEIPERLVPACEVVDA